MFPDRLKRIFPREANHSWRQPVIISNVGSAAVVRPEKLRRMNGHLGTRKFRVVCKGCNTGWMNSAEQAAFEVIEPLILGQPRSLSVEDINAVNLFCGILFSMIDRDHPPTSSVGQEERTYIYEKRQLPEHWYVLIGRTQSPDWTFRFHHVGGMGSPRSAVSFPDRCNTQICTVGLGELVLHVMSAQGWHLFPTQAERHQWAFIYGMALTNPEPYPLDWGKLPILSGPHLDRCTSAMAEKAFASSFKKGL